MKDMVLNLSICFGSELPFLSPFSAPYLISHFISDLESFAELLFLFIYAYAVRF